MGIRKYKPTTPGRRGASGADFSEITRSEPEKSLVRPLHSRGGRNVHGRVTARHQGGGHKRAYRLIDFRRADKDGVPAKVAHLEYDPNRTSRIALLHYADGEKRYIICPAGLAGGGRGESGPGGAIKPGNRTARSGTSSARRAWRWVTGWKAVRGPTSSRVTRCRCAVSRPAPWCTRSSYGPVAAPRLPGRRARASSSWPRRAATPSCGCRPARSGGST